MYVPSLCLLMKIKELFFSSHGIKATFFATFLATPSFQLALFFGSPLFQWHHSSPPDLSLSNLLPWIFLCRTFSHESSPIDLLGVQRTSRGSFSIDPSPVVLSLSDLLLWTFSDEPSLTNLLRRPFSDRLSPTALLPRSFSSESSPVDLL